MPVLTFTDSKDKNYTSVLLPKGKIKDSKDEPSNTVPEEFCTIRKKCFWGLTYIATIIFVVVFFMTIVNEYSKAYSIRDACPRDMSYRCSGIIPIEPRKIFSTAKDLDYLNITGGVNPSFVQDYEIDIMTQKYMMIKAPYKDKRNVIFIHDFEHNTTTIVDIGNKKCFMMFLDRDLISKPQQLFIKINANRQDFANITKVRMRSFMVPLGNRKGISCYTFKQCAGRPIYRLVTYDRPKSRVVPTEGKFAEYAGKGIVTYEIVNYAAITSTEKFDLD